MAVSKNDITGDSLHSRPLSDKARDRWDAIFDKRREQEQEAARELEQAMKEET